jgi:hypothetical protein
MAPEIGDDLARPELIQSSGCRRPYGEPHFMVAGDTLIDPNSAITALWKPFDARDVHYVAATARRPFG